MPRKEGQKIKLMVLLEILEKNSDAEHPVSVPRLLQMLEQRDISAERKSIYDDIATLQGMGYPIELLRGRGGGYYLAEGRFQLPELKLLVDAVQASRFITRRKSQKLIEKLEGFVSVYQAGELRRQVLVSGRVKSQDERIYYWVDALHRAIDRRCQITFAYRDWNVQKQMVERHPGKTYQVSPWALVWEQANYYLIAYSGGGLRHYRVDKMAQVSLLEDVPREGAEAYRNFDVTKYVQQMFNMFGGPQKQVTLRCETRFSGAMIDRFGQTPLLFSETDGAHFTMEVPVQVSPQFYGWVAGFGGSVEILAPAEVRAEFSTLLQTLCAQYPNVEN